MFEIFSLLINSWLKFEHGFVIFLTVLYGMFIEAIRWDPPLIIFENASCNISTDRHLENKKSYEI